MRPRRIASVLAAAFLFGVVPLAHAEVPARPRLLLAERDPFTGLPALKARYAAFDHPAAGEICLWLDGYWSVGEELVQTQ